MRKILALGFILVVVSFQGSLADPAPGHLAVWIRIPVQPSDASCSGIPPSAISDAEATISAALGQGAVISAVSKAKASSDCYVFFSVSPGQREFSESDQSNLTKALSDSLTKKFGESPSAEKYAAVILANDDQGTATAASAESQPASPQNAPDKEALLKQSASQLSGLSDPAAAAKAFDGSIERPDLAAKIPATANPGDANPGSSKAPAASALAQNGANPPDKSATVPPAPQPSPSPIDSPNPNWDAVVNPADNPCVDFYQYTCSNWNKDHPIPPDQSSSGIGNTLALRNESDLRQILESAASHPDPKDSDQVKLGDLYASCMDEQTADALGIKPLQPEFDRIAALKSTADLAAETAHLHEIGVGALFSFGSGADDKDSSQQIADVDQGGFTLPDRDYYLSADNAQTLQAYESHMRKMFILLGDTAQEAAAEEASVMAIETALAKASLDGVSRRVPANDYHMQKLPDFEKATAAFNWAQYLAAIKAPAFSSLNVVDPGFFKGLNTLIAQEPLSAWKSYLRWQVLNSDADLLSNDVVAENFDFNGRILAGRRQMKPRWKYCVGIADSVMGEALGRAYVENYFPPASKTAASSMVREEESAMANNIRGAAWMGAKTKAAALKKLSEMTDKIGYPDHWQDYSKLQISRGNLVGNMDSAAAFGTQEDLDKIGKKTDRSKWGMTPPTVNAYYATDENDINFPAGILQPPFFNGQSCLAENLGGIGSIIGHEMTHGFDDQGSQYDGQGNRNNWWTPQDKAAFNQRTQCLVNEYSKFVATPDPDNPKKPVMVNGQLTLGENTADNGGVRIAYMTLQNALAQRQAPRCSAGHWTDEQVFFLSFAQAWCGSSTPQAAKLNAKTDVHSPDAARVNGVLQNMPEFQKAFNCPANSPMIAGAKACRVW